MTERSPSRYTVAMEKRILALGVAALLAGSCTTTVVSKKVGDPCVADSECSSIDYCMSGVCTHVCSGQLDCPVNFDCGLAKAGDTMPTCYKASWDQSLMGGFGTDCSSVALDCGAGMNPCAAGFTCFATLKCDPDAYCTKSCTMDLDCPASMFCATLKDGSQTCLKRAYCNDCAVDDQCPTSYVCVAAAAGGRYCAKSCATDADCPRPLTGNYFERCLGSDRGAACQPAPADSGTGPAAPCHGPSILPGITGMGGVCANCRPGVPTDCATGFSCFVDDFTLERWCTEQCSISFVQNGTSYSIVKGCDCCPTGSYCYFGAVPTTCGAGCSTMGLCTGDSSYTEMEPTCYP